MNIHRMPPIEPQIIRKAEGYYLQSPVGNRYLTWWESVKWRLGIAKIKDFY